MNAPERLDPLITKTCYLDGSDPEKKREEIRSYFHQTFSLYESLFDCLACDDAYYTKATPLRHPLIFYYGHTAVFFINKLHVAKLIPERLDPRIESMLAIGVDEMSWDDLNDAHYDWPTPTEVLDYRNKTRDIVDDLISSISITLPIGWDDPLWIVMMGIEHERIHLETSSVLMRQLPLSLVKPSPLFKDCSDSGEAPTNALLPVSGRRIEQGCSRRDTLYRWDNEYGYLETPVANFNASKYLTSNGEFLAFVEDGGYTTRDYWDDEGWGWLQHSKACHPSFWIKTESDYRYRTIASEIDMPWNWPVDVNALEAAAFCRWKSAKTGKNVRLPTEAEWFCLREEIPSDQPNWKSAPGNINLEHGASACPVDRFGTVTKRGEKFFDIIGNVWQWTQTPIDGLPGFEVHEVYDDFSTPTFDGQHNLIKGGSYFSTGNSALKDSRYAFRRHFFQHAGFRYVEGEEPIITTSNPYETDEQVSQYIEFHFGSDYHGVPNFAGTCGQLCLKYFAEKTKKKQSRRALDLGCAIGRTSFELAREFDHVDGIDFSARFVSAATQLKENDSKRYTIRDEGDLFSFKETSLAEHGLAATAHKCDFWQGDACNLSDKFNNYDLVFAGNLIDRLYEPDKFVSRIHELINEDGLLVITSPYTWLSEFTEPDNWIGGYKRDGENFTTLDGLKEILSPHFDLVDEPRDVPFVIRETARKFQHSIAQMSVWHKRAK
jgi:5-histidylcysteine sulfoxide synthase/putative 4-mercaptohistidine N1-methyltranferase